MYNKLYIYVYDLYSPVASFFLCVCVCACIGGKTESNHEQTVPGRDRSVCDTLVEFHVCACTAFHFQITLSQYNSDFFSHGQYGVYIPGVHTVGG